MKTESIGEMRLKWAVTATLTELPSVSEHGDGVQVTVMSLGETVTNDVPSSVRTAQVIRLVDVSQGAPLTHEVG